MALKALMLRKKIDSRNKELEALIEKRSAFSVRESELETAIAEAETAEDEATVEEAIEALNAEKAENDKAVEEKEAEIAGLKAELEAEEKDEPEETDEPVEEVRSVEPEHVETRNERSYSTMDKRNVFAKLSMQERSEMFQREDIHNWLENVRKMGREKRAIENIGLTIPQVFMGYIRELIPEYSKLLKHVDLNRINGEGRLVIMGGVHEAIWTECCANLNEMAMNFNDATVDCFKVGGYYAVCNANLEDSDVNLASEILNALARGIGYALDKAILYGKNTSANSKMPLGIVSRLVQAEQPSDYSATARAWADLHTSNVVSITAANSTGVKLFQNILTARMAIKNNFSMANLVWVMNETTFTKLQIEAMTINAAGAIVTGMGNTMPVVGGTVEILDFVPDNVIVAGHFDLYLLAERAGAKFASSEHVRFLQDQTVYKGTARYDGLPLIAEAFAAIGIAGTTPNATMTFAADTANS